MGSLYGFTYGTADGKINVLLLGSRIVLVDGLKLGTEKVTELGVWDWKLLVTTFGSINTWYI